MNTDDRLREAVYEAFQEVEADPTLDHERELERLQNLVRSNYQQLINDALAAQQDTTP